MKTILENNTDFNVKLEPSDWRFSAAIVGLLEYFEYIDPLETSYKVEDEYILYNSELITKENYLKFVEKKYGENLHHKYVELNLEHYNQDNNENDKEDNKMKETLKIEGMMCEHCKKHVEEALNAMEGVKAAVNLETKSAEVTMDKEIPDAAFAEVIEKAGYQLTGVEK